MTAVAAIGVDAILAYAIDNVSHLRCLNFVRPLFPALPGWATFCRASGALTFARSIRDSLIDTLDW